MSGISICLAIDAGSDSNHCDSQRHFNFTFISLNHFVPISLKVFPDNFMRREVQALAVHCTFEEDGCKWKGEVRHLEVNGVKPFFTSLSFIVIFTQ